MDTCTFTLLVDTDVTLPFTNTFPYLHSRSHLLVFGCNNGIPMSMCCVIAFYLLNLCSRSIDLAFIESVRVGC